MKHWTDEERQMAIHDYRGGMSAKQIAMKLGRTPKAVTRELAKMKVRLTREEFLNRARATSQRNWKKRNSWRLPSRLTATYKDEQL